MRPRGILALLVFLSLAVTGPAKAAGSSAGDTKILRAAFYAADHGRWSELRLFQHRLAHTPLAAKLTLWTELCEPGSGADFEEITRFIDKNPDWPNQSLLETRAEESITEATPALSILAWFDAHKPATPSGKVAYGRALLESHREAEGTAALRTAWIEGTFGHGQEKTFLSRYGGRLRPEDDVARLSRLAWDGREEEIHRLLPRVDPGHRALALARLALANMENGVPAALAKVPRDLRDDPGLLYERLRWRRRKDLDEQAWDLLRAAPQTMERPEAWWTERAIMARRALQAGRVSEAYQIAARHGLAPHSTAFADAEWLSGWIALRFLEDKKEAIGHFTNMYYNVTYPLSRARGAYWAGRAADALKDKEQAQIWYSKAGRFVTTYYGQLAAARLNQPIDLPESPVPTPEEARSFQKRELVRAASLLHELGLKDRVRPFVIRLQAQAKTPGEHALIADLALSFSQPDLAILVGKRSNLQGIFIVDAAYPLLRVPGLSAGDRPERALVLSVLRQESAFDARAVSSAGAEGLMQIMPATARKLAKEVKLKFSPQRLREADYNVRLGRAYLGDLLENFGGSYVLALAAYNAGPARTREWMHEMGDPRDHKVDVVDWIESVPFPETRNYIQRVLEGIPIYRRRLGATTLAFDLEPQVRR